MSTSASTAYMMEGAPAKSGYYSCKVNENSVASDASEKKIMVFAGMTKCGSCQLNLFRYTTVEPVWATTLTVLPTKKWSL